MILNGILHGCGERAITVCIVRNEETHWGKVLPGQSRLRHWKTKRGMEGWSFGLLMGLALLIAHIE